MTGEEDLQTTEEPNTETLNNGENLTPAAVAIEEASSLEGRPEEKPTAKPTEEVESPVKAPLEAPPPRELSTNPNLRWYVVHVYSGFEFKVRQALEERIRTFKFTDSFGEIHVPQETVVELVRGEKKTSNRKFFPGYILVQMVLNQDTWHLVKETPKVTGFVGDASDPAPLSDEEVERVRVQVQEGAASPRSKASFEQGEAVKVIDGPFADFNGTVEEVKPEKGKVRVLISIFGRATPVELDFIQVEKS